MPLLRSKIRAPALPDHAIDRSRLLEPLLDGDWVVAVLHAPAGYGKSVLAAQVHQDDPEHTAWLYLEPEDAEPRRFCRYLVGALGEALPTLGRTELADAVESEGFEVDAWLEDLLLFFQELARSEVLLVLDNYESVADATEVTRLIERLLRHAAPTLRLLLTTRSAPGFRFGKLVERGDAVVLRDRELAFDLEEFKEASRAQGRALTDGELEALWVRSEGWCVYPGFASTAERPGEAAGVGGYLEEEILDRVPDDLMRFLRDTAALDVISGDAIEALGRDGAELVTRIGELVRHGIPHLSVADGRGVRLHPLVRERLLADLRRHATDEDRAALDRILDHHRSSGHPGAAIRALLELGAFERVLEIVTEDWERLGEEQLLSQVDGWLDRLPEEVRDHPRYVLARVQSLRFRGENRKLVEFLDERRASGRPIEEAVQLWTAEAWARTHLGLSGYDALRDQWDRLRARADAEQRLAGEYTLLVTALYDLRFEAALEHCEVVFASIPADSPVHRARALNARATVLHELGRSAEALEIFEKAIAFCRSHGETAYRTLNLLGKAFVCKDTGRFRRSLEAVEECLAVARDSGSTRLVLLPHAARTRGEVAWYLGRAAEAFAELEGSYALFQDHNRYEALATGVLIDHWRSVRGEASRLVTDEDFRGGFGVSEARVRHLIRRGRAETDGGDPAAGIRTLGECRKLAREMPSWTATAWLTEAWACMAAGSPADGRRALENGLRILEELDRPAYPLADAALTAFIVAESVATDLFPGRARALVTGEGPVDLSSAFREALGSPGRPAAEATRLVAAAVELGVRGLDGEIESHETVPASWRDNYAAMSAAAPLPPLHVRLFGAFEVAAAGSEVRFPRTASRRILGILLVEYPRAVHEERLLDLLWPEADPQKAKRNLQTSVNDLRRSLDPHHRPRGDSYVVYRDEHYELRLPPASFVDLHVFREAMADPTGGEPPAPSRITAALDLYRGDLLAEEPYEEYASEPRERERSSMLDGCAALASAPDEPGEHAERLLRRGLEVDPFWGEGVALLMGRLRDRGRVLAATRLYRDYEARLERELGVEPDPPLRALFEDLTGSR